MMSSSTEGLWNAIVGVVVEVERDEIARIIGSKRIHDNQMLWEEVKAYNDILSETHMLACDDLNERFQASTSSSSSNKAQAKTSSSNVVPLLSLTSNDKNKQNVLHPSNNKQQAKVVGSGGSDGFLSTTTEHSQHFRDEAKKTSSHRQQQHSALDSPGSRLTTARSTSRSTNGTSSSTGSHGYLLAHGDAMEFVMSIQEYLTIDRISIVLDDVKDAFELEHKELLLKIKQLEQSMETDCDVVSTNRSQQSGGGCSSSAISQGGNKATSPLRNRHVKKGSDHDQDIFDNHAMSKYSKTKPISVGVDGNCMLSMANNLSPPSCSVCGGDVGDYLSLSNDTDQWSRNINKDSYGSNNKNKNNNTSDRRNLSTETLMCLDCRARSRREKKLLNRLPKQSTVGNSQEFKIDHVYSSSLLSHGFADHNHDNDIDGYLNKYPNNNNNNSQKDSISNNSQSQQATSSKSTFRNRLQAARDEHHFIEDDYLP